ncbi:MAG: molybdopterin cofactor-binding domain-containing protein [Terriglobales bacterium]
MKPGELNWDDEMVASDLTPPAETIGSSDLSRRQFMTLTGAGLLLFFWTDPAEALQSAARAEPGYPSDFNAYLHIAPDGRVTCLVGKIEMGQGAMTSLAMLLAEELDVALDSVDMVMGDTDLCPWDRGTFGSRSIRQFGPVLRGAGAEARAVLLAMAAERLHAPLERLQVKGGVVTDPHQGKSVSYGQLVEGKRIERHIENVAVKPVTAFKIHGQSPSRKDGLEKVTGKAKFAGDIRLPRMLHTRLLRPPAHGARLKDADTSAAEKIAGVQVVREGDLIAVLHERREVADKALALVKAQFERPPAGVNDLTIFDHLLKTAPDPKVLGESGDLKEGEKLASNIVETTYLNSYVAHAPIETHSATASFERGKMTVWASTQTPFPVKQQIAEALNLSPDNVRVITPYVGGGFGGKSASRQAIEAARLSRALGVPVQVVFDRYEEFFFDTFRPAAVVKVRAGLTDKGRLALWDYIVYFAGDREAQHFYDIPHHRTRSSGTGWTGIGPKSHPFAVGPWRAPGVSTNTFARESHIDMLANKAGVDPVEFRLAHLTDKRMRRVLETAARQFGWSPHKTPSGRGIGVACGTDVGSYVATMAEVAVDKSTGQVQVKRVVCAQDQGVIVNLDGSRQQMEGCIMMGLGYALTEEMHFSNGELLDRNFDSYEIPRFSWMPKTETVLIDNPATPASGCGEPAIVTMGAVLANAVYDAVGVRLLQLPMTPTRLKEQLRVDVTPGPGDRTDVLERNEAH